MAYSVCGHPEETDTHAVFECPLTTQIWEACGLMDDARLICPRIFLVGP